MRTFDQILSDVTAQSDPQRKVILNQIASLPGQESAAESGVTAQKDQAYKDILSGAQQRGLGFSGIPLAEQAKYNATNYAPAVANLKSTYANNQNTLEGALANVGSNDYSNANTMYNQEQQLGLQQQQAAEQQRQFNANLDFQKQQAARQGASDSWLGNLFRQQQQQQQGQQQPAQPQATMTQRADKGFNFTDQNGNAINAAQYAHLTGQNFRDVLAKAAAHGDMGSKQALGFVGNDYGYDPTKVTNQNIANLYKALTGQGATVFQTPQQKKAAVIKSNTGNNLPLVWGL